MRTVGVPIALCAMLASLEASAQHVLMRRPVPSLPGTISIPGGTTPTPTPTPTPPPGETPSPTPTPTPGGPGSGDPETSRYPVHLAVGMCGAETPGRMFAFCVEIDEQGGATMASDSAKCATQSATNPAYLEQAAYYGAYYTIIPPAQSQSANGSSCSQLVQAKTYGSICQGTTQTCYEVTYETDPYVYGGPAKYLSARQTDVGACRIQQNSVGEGVADMLVRAGFTPAGPGGNEACTAPQVYAATGTCTTTTTSNPDGSTTIDRTFSQSCYAVRNIDATYGTWTLSPASNAQCDSANNSPEGKELIARYLSPYLVDPSALVKTCYLWGGVALNYQRDTETEESMTSYERTSLATYENSSVWPDGISHYEVRRLSVSYPYVCTDVDAGLGSRPGYYRNANRQGTTYDPERYPCNVSREVDKERLRMHVDSMVASCIQRADDADHSDGRTASGAARCTPSGVSDDGSYLTVVTPHVVVLH